jgi:putative addiction module CopG family antidote
MVQQKVHAGMYASASEVICAALRLMAERDPMQSINLAQLRQQIQDGLDIGDAVDWDAKHTKRAGRANRAAKSIDAQ